MFKCARCQKSSPPNEKLTRQVVATRDHKHPMRQYKNKRGETVNDPGNDFATQIVKEESVCRVCATGIDALVEKFNRDAVVRG